MQTLSDYLKSTGENALTFARRSGIPASTVYRLVNGERPNWDTMEAILKATNQQVTPNDFAGGLLEVEGVPEGAAAE